ncbi:hypothetical protein Thiowin_00100 [Thiorhodovibrio winogradskyi]|uniref:DUF2325 domain-containing protein n=1 Tax=Thiorhodovibrio winogradskyi TaxID=77007 RepID=A0ABZ0S3M6_9GAMM|nr:hypothetical protein [Thiorhodovibrio winogradskyi]
MFPEITLLWDARLLLDCDNDELAFVGAAHARPLADWLQTHGRPPTLADLPGRRWSELAMSLAPAFDALIFLCTPRCHKGLLETAQALASLQRPELLYHSCRGVNEKVKP